MEDGIWQMDVSENGNIDLQAGRNVLLLSIDGDGHATDRERLVFLVQ